MPDHQRVKNQTRKFILDAGTGTGIQLPILKEAVGPSGTIVALDFAEEMIRRAKGKHGDDQFSYVVGDLTSTPFADSSFDEVICNSCFPHIQDQEAAAREMLRILKPGGRATVCHTTSREELNSMHNSLGGVVGNDTLPADDEMQSLFSQAGFTDISIIDQAEGYIFTAIKDRKE